MAVNADPVRRKTCRTHGTTRSHLPASTAARLRTTCRSTAGSTRAKPRENGVRVIAIDFDGSGDSGQVEDMRFGKGDASAVDDDGEPPPLCELDAGEIVEVDDGVKSAFEEYIYVSLNRRHPGWEINAGAYGTFTFELVKKENKLTMRSECSFYERIEEHDTDEEEFEFEA